MADDMEPFQRASLSPAAAQFVQDLRKMLGYPRQCGRWGYRCDRLFCQGRCARLDDDPHGKGEHRCQDHRAKVVA